MIKILSQKIDTVSDYSDELFVTYHYPARYQTQLQIGDVFVYYQGNRYDRSHRYYFGTGRISGIKKGKDDTFYAALADCIEFEHKVPIHLPSGGYIEQIDYLEVRKRPNPPWQSSIRPLSKKAFDYIMKTAGRLKSAGITESLEIGKEKLKRATKNFYLENNSLALLEIQKIAGELYALLQSESIPDSHKKLT